MLALLLLTVPYNAAQETRVDVIEESHVYTPDCAEHCLSQLVAWEYANGVERCVGWRIWGSKSAERTPRGWRVFWWDERGAHEVIAPVFRRSWLQHDVELIDRERFPKCLRRELR